MVRGPLSVVRNYDPVCPFIHLFGSIFDLESGESDTERYGKVLAGVEGAMPGQGESIAPFVATLLGIKLEGDATQAGTLPRAAHAQGVSSTRYRRS